MELIIRVPFWCDACNKEINGLVYSEHDPDSLPESEKPRILEWLKHCHQRDSHTDCWNCGKNIKPHEISNHIVWDGNTWKELCSDCAQEQD